MPRVIDDIKRVGKSNEKYQVSVYLDAKEADAVKAISLAQDVSISSVIVDLMKQSLADEKYQKAIQAYQNFKKTLA